MNLGRRICSVTPHEDIENGFPRQPVPYHIAVPDAGITEDTGLIFFIEGFGGHPTKEYTSKLLGYLANQYNCLSVCVEYFDINMKILDVENFSLDEEFFDAFEKALQADLPQLREYSVSHVLTSLAKFLSGAGIKSFPTTAYVTNSTKDCYQSFGILPALDHLSVLSEILNIVQINKKRLFILGTSYGGYIANILGKLAPNTFQLIVDNSGFTETLLSNTVDDFYTFSSVADCRLTIKVKSLWSSDSDSSYYFDCHHAEIRSLLYKEHQHKSKTKYFCAHSIEDALVPVSQKEKFRELMSNRCDVILDIVDKDKVDGRLYKNLDHGMNASLRGVFDKAYNHYMTNDPVSEDQTDFDRESEYDFPCSNGYSYHIKFTKDDVKMTLHPPE